MIDPTPRILVFRRVALEAILDKDQCPGCRKTWHGSWSGTGHENRCCIFHGSWKADEKRQLNAANSATAALREKRLSLPRKCSVDTVPLLFYTNSPQVIVSHTLLIKISFVSRSCPRFPLFASYEHFRSSTVPWVMDAVSHSKLF